jgi:hypothetical protein
MIEDDANTPDDDESTTALLRTPTPTTTTPTVCVIGGGPGAMFFCHSLETQKNELILRGEDISSFPTIVKCFERSSGSGGVWRSDRTHGDKKVEEEENNENDNISLSSDNVAAASAATATATATAITMDVDININIVLPPSSSISSSPCRKKMRDSYEEEVEMETATATTLTSSSSSSSLTAVEGVIVEAVGVGVEAVVGVGVGVGAVDVSKETSTDKKINMYSALWTNGHKEAFEFYDYTFVDHFGYDIASKLPTYLPRSTVLDYLIARVTNKCPEFFSKYFSYNTSVINVKYIELLEDTTTTNKKFQVTIRNELTGLISIEYYDKCIWAGGNEGIPVSVYILFYTIYMLLLLFLYLYLFYFVGSVVI